MADKTREQLLEEALREAIDVARACKEMCDEPGNQYFRGERPSWKRAALAVVDEVDSKPDRWEELL